MSTDYTSCPGNGCPIKEQCYRFFGPKEPLWQSYFDEIPGNWIETGELDPMGHVVTRFDCEMFWGETQTSIMNQLKDIMK